MAEVHDPLFFYRYERFGAPPEDAGLREMNRERGEEIRLRMARLPCMQKKLQVLIREGVVKGLS